MTLTRLGEVITFYSYKGGTGRSMVLSNIACQLAKRRSEARGVLVIDWDLEAPGLHCFFYNDLQRAFVSREDPARALDEHPGLIDLFLELEALGLTRLHGPIGVKRSCSVKGVEDGLERQALLA